ncbi:MAG: CooT family nickel-binding protein [Chloroflexi bacterium]|nr:CooT family nickel-binding protein [Chloroflexota bacterium]
MCLAKVYSNKTGNEPIMEGVARLKIGDGRVEIATLFGEQKVISGEVLEVDFASSRVTVDVRAAPAKSDKE